MKKLILLSLVLLGVLVAPFAMAQSRQINYQGNILDQQDKPFQGPVQMTFELYDKEFGGTQLWSEIQNVTLNNGYFNVYLGSVIPFSQDFQFNRELWVQVTVGNGGPFKRTPLTMVPAAFASEYSDVAGFAQDIPDGSVTLIKLNDEVKTMGGDLTGTLPNPRLRPGAALANIENGSITQEKLSPNVTTRPSGAAGGDLTGFFPDPLIAEGAVKTNRIADFAVTTEKLALGSVTYDRFQDANGPIGTILGWDGDEWIETDVPSWELGRVKNVLPGDAAYAEYDADALGFWEITLGVADAGITTAKIANDAVTYAKLQNAANGNGTILAWNGTDWYETTVPALEADGIIGNEILNATTGRGLERVGLGTTADPYTLGIANNGVITEMLADDAVTLDKLAPVTNNGQVMWFDSVNNQWALTVGTAMDNYVMRWYDNGITRELRWSSDDATVGNELTDATAGRGLLRAGTGTTADPYTVGIADAGVVTSMIADANVTFEKLADGTTIGNILAWNGTQWVENTVPMWEEGRQKAVTAGDGTYVINTTDANGFISTEVGIDVAGVEDYMIDDEAVTLAKLADGTEMGQVMYFDNVSNTWLLSSGFAPVEDQVIKWVDNGLGQLQPQWANDDLTLPAYKIENEAVTLLTIVNDGNAPAMQLEGRTTMSDGLLNNSAFEVYNDAGGRGATIIGGTANDQNMGAPYEANDPIADDDAALIVANFEHLNGAVYPAYTTALRAYGDIWTNARVGAEEGIFNLINVNTLNVVDLFAVNAEIDNLTVNNPAAFLSDVDINGDLNVAQDVFLNTDGGLFTTFVNYLDVTNDAVINNDLAVVNDAFVGNNFEVINNALVGNDLEVLGLTTTDNLLVNTTANILNLFATNGDIDNLQVNNNAFVLGDVDINGELNVAQDVFLNTGGVFTTYAYNLDITNDAIIGNDFGVSHDAFVGNDISISNDASVGNNLEVLGVTTTNTLQVDANANVDGTLDVTGNTTLDGSLFVDDATTLDNSLTVTGASTLQATAVNGNLNANSRFIMSTTNAANLAALVAAINNGFTVLNYSTNVPAELNLISALPAGVLGQVIYIINSSTIGDITVGTLLNPVSVSQNQLTALIYNGTNWIPMAN